MDSSASSSRMGSFKANRSPKKMIIMTVVAVVALIVLLCGAMYVRNAWFSSDVAIEGGKYQAIFLTNGQVYFGHLSNVDGRYAKLTQIYYLQVQQQVQPSNNSNSSQQPQVSLTKLGNELHGPEDSMYIARDQILFWENLKDTGKVVQAIKQSLNQH